ncbi:unnamed protein product [Ectocarpus sp. CCAP 1310/34]|nr:unnamed protein product [Ectocarpus sp. CCAP 1310/34]
MSIAFSPCVPYLAFSPDRPTAPMGNVCVFVCVRIHAGNFGRSDYARKNGLDKMVGYTGSADDSKLEGLMDILRFFDEWRASLEARPTLGDWKAHFITDHSWTDIRVCILGTVSMCRYLFEKDSRFKIYPLSDVPHFINLRCIGQDIVEHRYGHMCQCLGSHCNPTAAQAKERAAQEDLQRSLHGISRANHARKGEDFIASGIRGRIMLPSDRRRAVCYDAGALEERYLSCDVPAVHQH